MAILAVICLHIDIRTMDGKMRMITVQAWDDRIGLKAEWSIPASGTNDAIMKAADRLAWERPRELLKFRSADGCTITRADYDSHGLQGIVARSERR